MRITLVTSNRSMATAIAGAMKDLWHGAHLEHVWVGFCGVFKDLLPPTGPWTNYPLISPYSEDCISASPHSLPAFYGKHELNSSQSTPTKATREHAIEAMRSADRIIFICCDRPSVYYFDLIHRHTRGQPYDPFDFFKVDSLYPGHIRQIVKQGPGNHVSAALSGWSRTQVKRYFDHQFAVNSAGILGPWLGDGHGWVSKYQIQLLYALRNLSPVKQSEWHERMDQWKAAEHGLYIPMGSVASRGFLFDQLIDRGWAIRNKGAGANSVGLSRKGQATIDRLHPDCEDPNLPMRIFRWQGAGLANSKAEIDDYILDFFGKQKSFMESRPSRDPN